MRICKTLSLKNDDHLIQEYIAYHAKGKAWPEITQGIKAIGILDMEIYIADNRLFMIMEVADDFDHDNAFARLALMDRQKEWESLMSKFQDVTCEDDASGKWKIIDRIFKLEE